MNRLPPAYIEQVLKDTKDFLDGQGNQIVPYSPYFSSSTGRVIISDPDPTWLMPRYDFDWEAEKQITIWEGKNQFLELIGNSSVGSPLLLSRSETRGLTPVTVEEAKKEVNESLKRALKTLDEL